MNPHDSTDMRKQLRLNCNRCGSFREYDRKSTDPSTVVRCAGCAKKHSTDSVYMVDPTRRFDRDDAGNLLEDPI